MYMKGVFLLLKICSKCKEEKELEEFYRLKTSRDGHRPDCKSCAKKSKKKFEEENPVRDRCNRMATGIMQRTVYDIDKPKNKIYKEHSVTSQIGNSYKGISDYLYENHYDEIKAYIDAGIIPSVDRIEPTGNYSPDNIRIIPLSENVSEGAQNGVQVNSKGLRVVYPNGKEKVFPSVSEASRELKKKRDTIIFSRDRGVPTVDGYCFYYLTGELSDEEKLEGELKYRVTIITNNILNNVRRNHLPTKIGEKPSEVKAYLAEMFGDELRQMLSVKDGPEPGIALFDEAKGYIPGNMHVNRQDVITEKSLEARGSVKIGKQRRGIEAILPDGTREHFDTPQQAAKKTGVHTSTVNRCIQLNKPSKEGIKYKAY